VDGNIVVNIYEKKFIFSGAFILLVNIFIYELGISLKNERITAIVERVKQTVFPPVAVSSSVGDIRPLPPL
jgi:hypothetical protein